MSVADPCPPLSPTPRPRRSARIALHAEVSLRRPGRRTYIVRIFDASCHGCKIEFVDRPRLNERAWVKFEGMQALEATVCWVDGFIAGVKFENPIHPAVFESLLRSWAQAHEAAGSSASLCCSIKLAIDTGPAAESMVRVPLGAPAFPLRR